MAKSMNNDVNREFENLCFDFNSFTNFVFLKVCVHRVWRLTP
jgi:hypothetical protein